MLASLKVSTKADELFLKTPSLKHGCVTSKILQQVVWKRSGTEEEYEFRVTLSPTIEVQMSFKSLGGAVTHTSLN